MSSGALTPMAAVESMYRDGIHHLKEPAQLAFLKNIAGGLQLSLAGMTALSVVGSCASLRSNNQGLANLLEGAMFSFGLIFVYMTGAELYTGYPMWMPVAALQRRGKLRQYLVAFITSLTGNLIGALIIGSLLGNVAGVIREDEAAKAFVIEKTQTMVSERGFGVILLKAIACGYLVTLAMLMGTQNMDGISKALALWLPFTVATAAQMPHTVEIMHIASLGMMLGAPLSIGEFLWKGLLPVILGNFIGGAVFTGAYHWWVYLVCQNGQNTAGSTFAERLQSYRDEDD